MLALLFYTINIGFSRGLVNGKKSRFFRFFWRIVEDQNQLGEVSLELIDVYPVSLQRVVAVEAESPVLELCDRALDDRVRNEVSILRFCEVMNEASDSFLVHVLSLV